MRIKINNKYLLTVVISGLFVLLFTYAGISKLTDIQRFSVELKKSPLLVSISEYVGIFIPVFELAIALLLITERFRLIALYSSFWLMALFSAYLISILNFSDYVPCTCGGVLQSMTWNQHIVFNISFLLLAAIAVLIYDKNDHVLQYNRNSRTPE